MSKNEAIVPAEAPSGTALAKPAKARKEILPSKTRTYVTARKRPGTFRRSEGWDISLTQRAEVDLSRQQINLRASEDEYVGLFIFAFVSSLIASSFGFVGLLKVLSGMAVHSAVMVGAVFGGLIAVSAIALGTGFATDKCVSAPLARRRRKRVIAGRPLEYEQVRDGVERLAAGAADPTAELADLPLESVFLALDHPNAQVRQRAAELAACLPSQVRDQAINHYRDVITVRGIKLLPDMEWLDPTKAAYQGKNRSPTERPHYESEHAEGLSWKLDEESGEPPRLPK